jgi:hypothetical protein
MPTDLATILHDQLNKAADTLQLLMARVDLLERELAEIKTFLRQPKGAVTRTSPDGTVAIRDPDIIAQQQRTGMRGYTPYTDPG